jgi:hypothetical protein
MALAAKSGTLVANTVTPVAVLNCFPGINVVNRSGSGTIWVRLDGVDPTVAGDNCFPVLGVRYFSVPAANADKITVKLISTAALDYTVESDPGGTP